MSPHKLFQSILLCFSLRHVVCDSDPAAIPGSRVRVPRVCTGIRRFHRRHGVSLARVV